MSQTSASCGLWPATWSERL